MSTPKQLEIMRVIVDGNPDGSACDLDELLERLSYKPTKAALQFSIRALIGHGYMKKAGTENRRSRRRIILAPTATGKTLMMIPVVALAASVGADVILGAVSGDLTGSVSGETL